MASGSPRYELTVVDKFHASHVLSCHKGKCGRLHGHTYRVELLFSSWKIDEKSHMVADFSTIKDIFRGVKKRYFDHHHLNDTLGQTDPTAEWIAMFIYQEMQERIRDHIDDCLLPEYISLERVTVWETENNAASFSMV